MFKVEDKSVEHLAERGTNKLIVKLNKNLFKAAKVKPKELVAKTPQAVVPEEKTEEAVMFEIY